MKREIKFRAWDEKQRYMAYQGTPDLETLHSFIYHFGDKILMQFTGLHDKNGKEIYEGDVCKVNYYELGLVNGVVKFRVFYSGYYLEGKQFQASMNSWEPDYIEIIGNIYENPELCKP